MTRYLRGRGLVVVTLALGALSLAAGIAYGTIPDSEGVIHTCVRQGDIRVIDTATESCKAKESPLDWNQEGPKGDQGDAGPAGPPGTDAAVMAFAASDTLTVSDPRDAGLETLVVEQSVPAGSYVVTATIVNTWGGQLSLPPNTTGGGIGDPGFRCFLRKNPPSLLNDPILFSGFTQLSEGGSSVITAGVPAGVGEEGMLALTGAYTAAEPTTPNVHCFALADTFVGDFAGIVTFRGSMTIVKVGSIG